MTKCVQEEERQVINPLVNKMNAVNLASYGSGGHASKGKKVLKNSENKHKLVWPTSPSLRKGAISAKNLDI